MLKLSYFSYKGGSGRTSLVYNTVPFLVEKLGATNKEPIIIVDLDVDSAGLSFLLDNDVIKLKNSNKLTTNELIDDANLSEMKRLRVESKENPKPLEDYPIFKRFTPVGYQFGLKSEDYNANNTVLFVPACPSDDALHFDLSSNTCIKDFLQFAKNCGVKAVIFDLPAGEQVSGRQALQYSDIVLVCFRITKQHRKGTFNYLERNLINDEKQKYIIVPSAVPDTRKVFYIDSGAFNFEAVKESSIERLEEIFESKGLNKEQLITEMFDEEWYGIPEVSRFKFEEGILYNIKKNLPEGKQLMEDEAKAFEAYDKLSKLITENIND